MTTSERIRRARPWGLLCLGLLLAFGPTGRAVLADRPISFGLMRSLITLAGLLLALEGALELRVRSSFAIGQVIAEGSRRGTVIAFGIALALMGLMLNVFHDYRVDDAFITFRYAKHLAQGLGVAWNPGETQVEGYSNFLWMLGSALALRFGADPLQVARLLGVACYVASAFVLRALAMRLGGSPGAALVAVLLFASVPAFAFWTMSGLETPSVVLLALLYLHAFSIEIDCPGAAWRTALFGTLLVLSRPDGLFFVWLSLLPLLWRSNAVRARWLARLVALAAPVVAVYFIWKWRTFGTVLPNTLSAKSHLLAGLLLTGSFFAYAFPILALWCVRAARGPVSLLERQIVSVAAGFLIAAINISPQVAHYHRFFLPAFAPLFALVAALPNGVPVVGTWRSPWLGLVAGLCLLYAIQPIFQMSVYAGLEAKGLREAHEVIGADLGRRYGPADVLAASDCGIIPYHSEMRTIDLWGLTDRTIGTHGFDPAYVMRQAPSVVILNSLNPDRFEGREAYDRSLHSRLERDTRYHVSDRRQFYGYWLWVFTRRPAG
jgi:hypothetical protein